MAEGDSGELGIASSSVPSDTGDADAGNKGAGEFAVPEEYADKGWTKDITSIEELWKKSDGAQSLIGQKAAPTADSSVEEWEAHYKSLGRPEEAGKYTFNREGFSEDFRNNQNDEYDTAVKGIFLKAGLNQKQVDVIQPEVEALAIAMQEQKAVKDTEAAVEQDKLFDEAAAKVFGTNRDQILADSKVLLGELAPKGFAEKIAGLDNDTLVILSGVLNNVKSKYINEDSSGGGDGNAGGETLDDLQQQARTAMQSDEYRDPFNPKSADKRKEVAALYERIATIKTK